MKYLIYAAVLGVAGYGVYRLLKPKGLTSVERLALEDGYTHPEGGYTEGSDWEPIIGGLGDPIDLSELGLGSKPQTEKPVTPTTTIPGRLWRNR